MISKNKQGASPYPAQCFCPRGSRLKSAALLLFFALFFCSLAHAQLLVGISPKDQGKQALGLYPEEMGELELTFVNDGALPLGNINIKCSASESLVLVEEGLEKTIVFKKIDSLAVNEKKILFLSVKPTQYNAKNQVVYVDYGLQEYTNIAAGLVKVFQSPLLFDAKLSAASMEPGSEGTVSLSIKNNGKAELLNIKAELAAPKSIEVRTEPVLISSLGPGEGKKDIVFRFSPKEAQSGSQQLALRLSFEDSNGSHALEKNFPIDVKRKPWELYFIVGVVIVFVGFAVYVRMKPKEQKKAPEKSAEKK
ncbi:MAG: NEW3 domain-containing protein [Candidatus Diapherotrites archaeon]|nr:NEW3 domain-containing protein [Candidatus Diapherotrites archaeon]